MSDMLPKQFKTPLTSSSKDDSGKSMAYSLCLSYFPLALAEVAKVSRFGMEKYNAKPEDKGFLQVPDARRRYSDALVRHLLAETKEVYNPADGNLRHDAQVAWNALARLEMALIEAHELLINQIKGFNAALQDSAEVPDGTVVFYKGNDGQQVGPVVVGVDTDCPPFEGPAGEETVAQTGTDNVPAACAPEIVAYDHLEDNYVMSDGTRRNRASSPHAGNVKGP
ncbi:MAG: hypothetical protein GEU78_07935 [Actinobacteria bacterium]|nr:hypothetical protein [Actinomycetota bacterium]